MEQYTNEWDPTLEPIIEWQFFYKGKRYGRRIHQIPEGKLEEAMTQLFKHMQDSVEAILDKES